MRKSYDVNALNNTKFRERQIPTTVRVNGQIYQKTDTTQIAVAVEVEKLSKQGLTTLSPSIAGTFSSDAESTAGALTNSTVLLASMDITVDTGLSKSFSLKDTQTDNEVVANPNLKDPNVGKKKKRNIKATDKFPCASDSFYNLDEAPNEYQRTKVSELTATSTPTTAIETVAGDLITFLG